MQLKTAACGPPFFVRTLDNRLQNNAIRRVPSCVSVRSDKDSGSPLAVFAAPTTGQDG